MMKRDASTLLPVYYTNRDTFIMKLKHGRKFTSKKGFIMRLIREAQVAHSKSNPKGLILGTCVAPKL